MKRTISTFRTVLIFALANFLICLSVFAQAPEKMSYQAVIRDAGNILVMNHAVGMQISILQGSATGTAVYVETQIPTTNDNGLVSIEIGGGSLVSGDFSTIDWSTGPYFIKTETDPAGGAIYSITGTSKLMSVPYALHAKTAFTTITDNVDDADADPTNELITGAVLNGLNLEITDVGGTNTVDLSGLSSLWANNQPDIYFNTGKVGIGIKNPTETLDINGNLKVFGNASSGNTGIDLRIGQSSSGKGGKINIMAGWAPNSHSANHWGGDVDIKAGSGENNSGGDISIEGGLSSIWTQSTTPTKVSIYGGSLDGNYGPSALIKVEGGIQNGSNSANKSGGNILLLPGTAEGTGTSGYVGVGTTTPAGILDIAGAYHFPGTDGSNGQVLVTDGSGVLGWASISGTLPTGSDENDLMVSDGAGNWVAKNLALGNTGGGLSVNNMQPYLALYYCIALEGIFPSRNAAEPFIAEIMIFGGNFAPRGWAFCDGQLLAISQYQALFSLVGTTYGGDGRTTFGLPDLRGRAPIHVGTGPGLSARQWGVKGGSETNTLDVTQIPAHTHTITYE